MDYQIGKWGIHYIKASKLVTSKFSEHFKGWKDGHIPLKVNWINNSKGSSILFHVVSLVFSLNVLSNISKDRRIFREPWLLYKKYIKEDYKK